MTFKTSLVQILNWLVTVSLCLYSTIAPGLAKENSERTQKVLENIQKGNFSVVWGSVLLSPQCFLKQEKGVWELMAYQGNIAHRIDLRNPADQEIVRENFGLHPLDLKRLRDQTTESGIVSLQSLKTVLPAIIEHRDRNKKTRHQVSQLLRQKVQEFQAIPNLSVSVLRGSKAEPIEIGIGPFESNEDAKAHAQVLLKLLKNPSLKVNEHIGTNVSAELQKPVVWVTRKVLEDLNQTLSQKHDLSPNIGSFGNIGGDGKGRINFDSEGYYPQPQPQVPSFSNLPKKNVFVMQPYPAPNANKNANLSQFPQFKKLGNSGNERDTFEALLPIYGGYAPIANRDVLRTYLGTQDYQQHLDTVKVYFNKDEMTAGDARTALQYREPVNIEMHKLYKQKEWLELGLKHGGFFEHGSAYGTAALSETKALKKADGSFFKDLPNTASVYSETYLWSTPGNRDSKKEIAVLSLPAPALDTSKQPHYRYYMGIEDRLNYEKYQREMEHLARTIVQAGVENQSTAFGGRGLNRMIIPFYGQGAFLMSLNDEDRNEAHLIFARTLSNEIRKARTAGLLKIPVKMSVYEEGAWYDFPEAGRKLLCEALGYTGNPKECYLVGDILATAGPRDFVPNPWDPHSLPGNGNDNDRSFDGAMGKGTGILLTQAALFNRNLGDPNRYIGIGEQKIEPYKQNLGNFGGGLLPYHYVDLKKNVDLSKKTQVSHLDESQETIPDERHPGMQYLGAMFQPNASTGKSVMGFNPDFVATQKEHHLLKKPDGQKTLPKYNNLGAIQNSIQQVEVPPSSGSTDNRPQCNVLILTPEGSAKTVKPGVLATENLRATSPNLYQCLKLVDQHVNEVAASIRTLDRQYKKDLPVHTIVSSGDMKSLIYLRNQARRGSTFIVLQLSSLGQLRVIAYGTDEIHHEAHGIGKVPTEKDLKEKLQACEGGTILDQKSDVEAMTALVSAFVREKRDLPKTITVITNKTKKEIPLFLLTK